MLISPETHATDDDDDNYDDKNDRSNSCRRYHDQPLPCTAVLQVCVQPRQLGCQHLLLSAVLRRPCCWAQALSIDTSCPPGAQQQTRRTQQRLSNDGTDRRTDKRTDGHPTVA